MEKAEITPKYRRTLAAQQTDTPLERSGCPTNIACSTQPRERVRAVHGAVGEVPKTWTDQLANNGRLVCVVQKGPVGHASIFKRSGDVIGEQIIFDASLAVLPGFERQAEFVL